MLGLAESANPAGLLFLDCDVEEPNTALFLGPTIEEHREVGQRRRDGVGDQGVDEYCTAEGIPILMRIPLERRIAEAYSEGVPLVKALPEYRQQFLDLYAAIEKLVAGPKE